MEPSPQPQIEDRFFSIRGEVVRTLRIQRGWTVEQLATKAICSVKTVQSAEKGSRAVISTIAKFAKAFGVECQELIAAPLTAPPAAAAPTARRIGVVIKLDVSFDSFDETDPLLALLKECCRLFAAKGMVSVESVTDGSVLIKLEVDEDDFIKLSDAFYTKRLDPHIIQIATTDPLTIGKPLFGKRPSKYYSSVTINVSVSPDGEVTLTKVAPRHASNIAASGLPVTPAPASPAAPKELPARSEPQRERDSLLSNKANMPPNEQRSWLSGFLGALRRMFGPSRPHR